MNKSFEIQNKSLTGFFEMCTCFYRKQTQGNRQDYCSYVKNEYSLVISYFQQINILYYVIIQEFYTPIYFILRITRP